MLGPTYDAIQAIAPSKPLLIGETASTEKSGSKADWITDALTTQIPRQLPERQGLRLVREVRGPGLADRDLAASRRSAFAAGIASPFYAGANFTDVRVADPAAHAGRHRRAPRRTSRRTPDRGRRDAVDPERGQALRRAQVEDHRQARARLREAVGDPGRWRPSRGSAPGFSLPVVVPAANAAIRITLNRDTKVVLRFARRSGKRYVAVPGAVKLALLRGEQGVLFAGRLSSEADAGPRPLPPRGDRGQLDGHALADGARHVHAAQVARGWTSVRAAAAARQPPPRSDV